MKNIACRQCGKTFPMNEMVMVFEEPLCRECAPEEIGRHEQKDFTPGSVYHLKDPTICARCQLDNGNEEFTPLAGAPLCDSCQYFFRHRPYPLWIKASLVAMIGLAVFSFYRNQRFFLAYLEWHQAQRLLRAGDRETAFKLIEGVR